MSRLYLSPRQGIADAARGAALGHLSRIAVQPQPAVDLAAQRHSTRHRRECRSGGLQEVYIRARAYETLP